jgi:hypothetical protein
MFDQSNRSNIYIKVIILVTKFSIKIIRMKISYT